MMVIQGRLSLAAAAQGVDYNTTTDYIFPAAMCSWTQAVGADGVGYDITNVRFWPGSAVNLTGVQNADALPFATAELGFIGKTGRFVKMTT